MNGPSKKLFPHTRLSFDEDGGIQRCYLFHSMQHIFQGVALTDDFIETADVSYLFSQVNDFFFESALELFYFAKAILHPLQSLISLFFRAVLLGDIGADAQHSRDVTSGVA